MILIERLDEYDFSTNPNMDVRKCRDRLVLSWGEEIQSRHALGLLVDLPLLWRVLTTWRNFTANAEKAVSVTRAIISQNRGLLQIFRQIPINPIKSHEVLEKIIDNLFGNDISHLEEVISIEELKQRILDLRSGHLDQKDKLIVDRFEEALNLFIENGLQGGQSPRSQVIINGVVDISPQSLEDVH